MKDYKLSDQWQTPVELFNILDKGGTYLGTPFKGFNFHIDLAATEDNTKKSFYAEDYLKNYFADKFGNHLVPLSFESLCNTYKIESAFMNCPYSNPKPFIEKAWEDSKHCKIVCLVKCDPSTQWWATFYNYANFLCPFCNYGYYDLEECRRCNGEYERNIGPKPGCETIYFPKRIKFDPPQQLIDSGEVWKVGNKWVQKCTGCHGCGLIWPCKHEKCKGKGYTDLSGPTFPSVLLVFDRRGL